MILSAGARLGPYEVVAPLGAGGMGEVYRARDLTLNRDVALKTLPAAFATDPERLARFRREAQVLASLNHPNIGQIYGFEEGEPSALVLELIDGPTLYDRLRSGPIAATEAVAIACQIAGALEAAHEQGIIHRDLKPANIKIKPDGSVKVLDFGLAKALAVASHHDRDDTPTITTAATEPGVLLGTAAYMSPEQAQGHPVDRRADIWAFGAVMYEMLTGRRAFAGENRSDTLAAVLRQEVDWQALPTATPPGVRRLLARCLDRDAKRRLRDIGEARIALEPSVIHADAGVERPGRVSQRAMAAALGAIAAAILIGTAWYLSLAPSPSPPVARFTIDLPAGQVFTGLNNRVLAMSPDGTRLAYVANGRLHLRSLSDEDAKPVQGTEGFIAVYSPVFSPDGNALAFYAGNGTLCRVAITGGAAVAIATANDVTVHLEWGPDGIIYGHNRGIWRVPQDGGTPEQLVSLAADEVVHAPQLLPGGQHLLFTVTTGNAPDRWNRARVLVQSLATRERTTVIDGGFDARYLETGHLVYALGSSVLVVPFDARRMHVTGNPVPLIDGVRMSVGGGSAYFTISKSGNLAYIRAGETGQNLLSVVDLQGRGRSLMLPPGTYSSPRVSPDGTRITFISEGENETTVWTYALSGATAMQRLTLGGQNRYPTWSADGARVAYQSDREGDLGIFWQPADGSGAAERLTRPDAGTSHEPESSSPDGTVLLFNVKKGSSISLWALSLRDRTAAPFGAVSSMSRTNAVFSPDGRWVAYERTTARGSNAFVEPYPPTGARYTVPASLATQMVWSRDGKQLFFNPGPGSLAVTDVSLGPTVTFSRPVEMPRPFATGPIGTRRAFDVTPDGRFVGRADADPSLSKAAEINSRVHVVLNWIEELKAKVPGK